jgi:hypothetical protein
MPEDESTIEASKVPEKKKPSFVLTSKLEPFAATVEAGQEKKPFKFEFKLEPKTFGFQSSARVLENLKQAQLKPPTNLFAAAAQSVSKLENNPFLMRPAG